MRAMVLKQAKKPLSMEEVPRPEPGSGQVLIRVHACGVCRTDLHIIDGELSEPKLPLIPGHQVVGTVAECGKGVRNFSQGDRVGVPWLFQTCGSCRYCLSDKENLCDHALYTGYQVNGGYAEFCVANESFCFPIDQSYDDIQAAPLLCAGLIGYRSYRMAGDAKKIGLYGFGAAAHIVTQVALYENKEIFAFTRPGDTKTQKFARKLGAKWAGSSEDLPPERLDGALIFAPVGSLVPKALKAVVKGGSVVCAGIHMSDIPGFPYADLWEERVIRSVANLTRQDARELLALAPKIPIVTQVTKYPLEKAGEALEDLRKGRFDGSAVLVIDK